MKKIEVTPLPGMKARYPLFNSAEALYAYMSGQATAAELTSSMIMLELDGDRFRRAFIEWGGIDPGPRLPGARSHSWMRVVRGVVETGPKTLPAWEPFYGWCHPGMLRFRDENDAHCTICRCDDDTTVDIDAVLMTTSLARYFERSPSNP